MLPQNKIISLGEFFRFCWCLMSVDFLNIRKLLWLMASNINEHILSQESRTVRSRRKHSWSWKEQPVLTQAMGLRRSPVATSESWWLLNWAEPQLKATFSIPLILFTSAFDYQQCGPRSYISCLRSISVQSSNLRVIPVWFSAWCFMFVRYSSLWAKCVRYSSSCAKCVRYEIYFLQKATHINGYLASRAQQPASHVSAQVNTSRKTASVPSETATKT